jgi:hypothetical protein
MKYYLRGLGVGLIISSLIFLAAFSFYKPKISDATLKAEAAKRGYTLSQKTDGTIKTSKKEEELKAKKEIEDKTQKKKKAALKKAKEEAKEKVEEAEKKIDDASKQADEATKMPLDDIVNGLTNSGTKVTQEEVKPVKGEKHFVVNSGDSSWTVAKSLKSMGLIDNDSEFDHYLIDNGYSQRINPGNFTIPEGSSYQDIAKIITRSR